MGLKYNRETAGAGRSKEPDVDVVNEIAVDTRADDGGRQPGGRDLPAGRVGPWSPDNSSRTDGVGDVVTALLGALGREEAGCNIGLGVIGHDSSLLDVPNRAHAGNDRDALKAHGLVLRQHIGAIAVNRVPRSRVYRAGPGVDVLDR